MIEGLLAELKAFSAAPCEKGEPAHSAVPAIITDVIKRHAEKLNINMCPEYFERAITRFDELDQQGSPYSDTLRQAASRRRHDWILHDIATF